MTTAGYTNAEYFRGLRSVGLNPRPVPGDPASYWYEKTIQNAGPTGVRPRQLVYVAVGKVVGGCVIACHVHAFDRRQSGSQDFPRLPVSQEDESRFFAEVAFHYLFRIKALGSPEPETPTSNMPSCAR